ncbi:hypothetical protein [Inquilinus limosus]|uniref:hypothetical protein n=1 Tax=Inquilinus limosus TaxID=171674 RepID=UPI0006896FCE|nr:hypothetical protein [Inquilinus limosus]
MRLSLTKDLVPLKEAAIAKIDAEAEIARSRYLTDGVGQTLVYQLKIEEATAVVRADQADISRGAFPVLFAEVGITVPETGVEADDIYAVAQVVLNVRAQWQTAVAGIEGLRLSAKRNITEASTPREIEVACNIAW